MKKKSQSQKKVSKYQEESEEDDFIVKKKSSKPKKEANTSAKGRLKKNKDASDDEYEPAKDMLQKEPSISLSLSFSEEDEKSKPKGRRNTQTKSRVKKEKVKKEEQQDSDREPEQIVISENKNPENFFDNALTMLPYFIQPAYIKDEEGRSPDDFGYDSSTLFIPIQDYQKMSPMFKQYWNAKKKNFDRVMFFRFGRWLHVFYQDALLIGKYFGPRIGFWGKERPFLTVYDSQYPIYLRGLLERGHQVCVIEQIERGELTQRDKGEIAKREVSQLISRGTFCDEEFSYETRYLMVILEASTQIKNYKYVYGVAMVDSTTNEFFIDQFYDDEQSNNLRSLLARTRPLEVLVPYGMRPELEKLIKGISNPQVNQFQREWKPMQYCFEQFKREFMDADKLDIKHFEGIQMPKQEVVTDYKVEVNINEGIYEDEENKQAMQEEPQIKYLSDEYPDLLKEFEKQYNFEKDMHIKELGKRELSHYEEQQYERTNYSYYYAVESLYLLVYYLRRLMLNETVYRRGRFQLIDHNFNKLNYLHLDSQALESLEIFQVNLQTKVQEKGSLFSYLSRCGSNFGKRMLLNWVAQPLSNIQRLLERQECVKDLVDHIAITEEFNRRIGTFIDLERSVTKIYNSLQLQRLKVTSFSGETFGQKRLKELSDLLKHLRKTVALVHVFDGYVAKFKSKRLKRLVTLKGQPQGRGKKSQVQEEGLFPDVNTALDELEKCLEIKDGEATPTQGVSQEYDQAAQKYRDILNLLDQELQHWRRVLKCERINYFHGKLRYQLEVPDDAVETRKPKELTITSKRKGFQRFQTEKIENLIYQLKQSEEDVQKNLIPFFQEYFTKFYSYKATWLQLISCLQELDCLTALAIVSSKMKVKCLPKFVADSDGTFHLENAIHPCLMESMPNVNWVSNTIKFDNNVDALLLTGPNMSGKSTLLRLAAVSVILAQVGCYVPAEKFQLSPIDRIFCRIGASDRLLEGKSTFFIEMEETKTILDQCTPNSLVIIDELGRGTSTYDGVAIASAVLRYLITGPLPKSIFATHYHILLDEFALHKNVKKTVMKHFYDDETQEVNFTYQLVEGEAEKSFATNVARIAGLPKDLIKKASEVEKKITKEEEKLTINRKVVQRFNQLINSFIN